MNQQTTPPYGLYAATLAGLIVARFADLLTSQTHFAMAVHASHGWWSGLALMAIASAWLTARYVRERVPNLMGLLLCMLVGGATTLLTASYVGMFIGGIVGLFTLFDRPRSFARRIGRMMYPTIPAMVLGFATGSTAWILIAQFGLASGQSLAWGLATFACGVVIWLTVACRQRSGRRWYFWIGAPVMFATFCLLGFVLSTWQDQLRRERAVAGRALVYRFSAWVPVRPMRTWRWAFPGAEVVLRKGATDRDLSYLAGLPFIESVHIAQESKVTSQGLTRLQLDHLISFACFDDSPLSDEALSHVGSGRRLQYLHLSGRQFSDQSLVALKSQPNLGWLSLEDTRITSAGFEKLFGGAPPLLLVDLSNTDVDDRIFAPLARNKTLQSLLLRGTKVTGSELARLHGTSVATLNLSGTLLEEAYLADLVPREANDPQAAAPLGLRVLNLGGIHISAKGIRSLAKLPQLGWLDISDADIDDASLQPLSNSKVQRLAVRADNLTPAGLQHLGSVINLNLHFDADELEISTLCSRAAELLETHQQQVGTIPGRNVDTSVTIKRLDISNDNCDDVFESLSVLRHAVSFKSVILYGSEPVDYENLSELEEAVQQLQDRE